MILLEKKYVIGFWSLKELWNYWLFSYYTLAFDKVCKKLLIVFFFFLDKIVYKKKNILHPFLRKFFDTEVERKSRTFSKIWGKFHNIAPCLSGLFQRFAYQRWWSPFRSRFFPIVLNFFGLKVHDDYWIKNIVGFEKRSFDVCIVVFKIFDSQNKKNKEIKY